MRHFSRISTILLSLGALAAIAWASNPWDSKPYQQWSQKDVQQVLEHSPWVQSVSVAANWKTSSMLNPGETTNGGSPMMVGGGPMGGAAGLGMQPHEAHVKFQARWISAETVREAMARGEILAGQITQAQATTDLAQKQTDYEILLIGPDMTPFVHLTAAELTNDSYLDIKGAKKKLEPSSVEIHRTPDGNQVLGITFQFPKTAANGEPMIGSNEKEVDFVCRVKDAKLNFRFHPRDMANRDGTDL